MNIEEWLLTPEEIKECYRKPKFSNPSAVEREIQRRFLQKLASDPTIMKEVGGKLPEHKAGREVDTWIALERELYKKAQQEMLKDGYRKVIPLSQYLKEQEAK